VDGERSDYFSALRQAAAWDLNRLARSVSKMPDAREDHCHITLVRGCDNFFVTD
jgi:hypothetical protein